jgi:hypothetical protein
MDPHVDGVPGFVASFSQVHSVRFVKKRGKALAV